MKQAASIIFSLSLLMSCGTNNERQENAIGLAQEVTSPTLKLSDLEGNKIELSQFEGKGVFLNLWATWCKPCLMEMPAIESAYQTLKDQGYVFLAASYEAPEKIREFKEKNNYSFPIVHLQSDIQALGIQSLPTTLIYNQQGALVEQVVGTRAWDDPQIIDQLKSWKVADFKE